MLLHFIICLLTLGSTMAVGIMNNTAKPRCQTECGGVTVPYPFGIGKDNGCSLDDSFYMTCKSHNGDKNQWLFLGSGNQRIHSISDTEIRIFTRVSYTCYNQNGSVADSLHWHSNLINSPFSFSEKNKFTVIGCDDIALIKGINGVGFSSWCVGTCTEAMEVPDGQCLGKGCCQTSITKGLQFYNVTLGTFPSRHGVVWSFNRCGYAFLGEEGSFKFYGIRDFVNVSDVVEKIRPNVPIVLDWVIGPNRSCSDGDTVCKGNSNCYDVVGGGYRCKCNQGYQGNPYLDHGCQDIDECLYPNNNTCSNYAQCINTIGSYNCTCPSGSIGDAKTNNCTCKPGFVGDAKSPKGCAKDTKFPWTIIIVAIGVGASVILLGIPAIFVGIRRRKLARLREKFFEQNGGVFLKQKIKSQRSHEAMTLFSTEQLLEATNNYSQAKIVGRGAYGVVYKGVLSDKRVVAIKKSKLVDHNQAEQFINEVMILTQVIHRNVVKLLGCCLEEEVPVLVYEFVSNNTLFHHIHDRSGGMSWLSWENRLRVAAEVAGALAYLHSDTRMPIVHRDVKSTNILLDDNYTAKISDFGASRLVPLDHEQVTTLIQGTLGYLDPQYFHSSQLTEKSDVYSFGVVLAELITGKKAIGSDRINKEKNLATFFVNSVEENRLFEIVEPRILREGSLDKIQAVGNLVKSCLNTRGEDRPAMKEVVVELDGLRKFTTHPWIQDQETSDQETTNLVLELEQSDLYDVPLVPHGSNEWESLNGSTNMTFEENKPR